MFRWTGALDRSTYAWRSGIAIAFLVVTIVFFPFVNAAIMRASHCAPTHAVLSALSLQRQFDRSYLSLPSPWCSVLTFAGHAMRD